MLLLLIIITSLGGHSEKIRKTNYEGGGQKNKKYYIISCLKPAKEYICTISRPIHTQKLTPFPYSYFHTQLYSPYTLHHQVGSRDAGTNTNQTYTRIQTCTHGTNMHTEIGNRENEEIDIQTQAKARKILLIIYAISQRLL